VWLAPPHGKCPEASQLYAVSLSESPGDLLKNGIEALLDISFVEMRIPSPEAQYQLGLDHGRTQAKCGPDFNLFATGEDY
jgi:hypothetical protein